MQDKLLLGHQSLLTDASTTPDSSGMSVSCDVLARNNAFLGKMVSG